jgi:hypothetical protein
MLNRRGFIEAGLAAGVASALGAISAARRADSAPGAVRLAPYVAVFDARFAQSREFGHALGRFGVTPRSIEGDVTELWYHELHPRWQQGPAAIAGLTTYGPLFCLEQLAWDHRLRVIYRGTHTPLTDGRVEHRLSGAMRSFSVGPSPSLAHWPREVARALALIDARDRAAAWRAVRLGQEDRYVSRPEARRLARLAEPLYSWVIA